MAPRDSNRGIPTIPKEQDPRPITLPLATSPVFHHHLLARKILILGIPHGDVNTDMNEFVGVVHPRHDWRALLSHERCVAYLSCRRTPKRKKNLATAQRLRVAVCGDQVKQDDCQTNRDKVRKTHLPTFSSLSFDGFVLIWDKKIFVEETSELSWPKIFLAIPSSWQPVTRSLCRKRSTYNRGNWKD